MGKWLILYRWGQVNSIEERWDGLAVVSNHLCMLLNELCGVDKRGEHE